MNEFGKTTNIIKFLQDFDAWVQKNAKEEFYLGEKFGMQSLSFGYEVEEIRPLSWGYLLNVFLLERATKQEDEVRMGDIVHFSYFSDEDMLYYDGINDEQRKWMLH